MAEPEPHVETPAPHHAPMVISHRMGWLALAVAPLFLAGLGAIWGGIHMQFLDETSHKPGAGWALMVFGLLVALAAAAGISMVWDIIIDRGCGLVTRRLGVLGMIKTRTFPLEEFTSVVVLSGYVKSHRRFRVHLAGSSGPQGSGILYLTEYSSLEQALAKAAEVGGYLDRPVRDLSAL